MKTLKSVRGMKDMLPSEANLFLLLSEKINALFTAYQFEAIFLPIIEKTELFARSIGTATDIVEKEMYTFTDRNTDHLTLRPEGTAGMVRCCIEQGLIHNQIRKFWYIGPMFRHERPQKGRYRQFYHVGAEVFGIATPDIEAEMLAMQWRLWKMLGIEKQLRLEINTIGISTERQAYREALINFLAPFKDQLDEDSQRRLSTNPLRILDSKCLQTQALLRNAPCLKDFLSLASVQHYEALKSYLNLLGIPFYENTHLVRGLDYYSHTVFEWTTALLGAQATVCGGGRYDGLVEQLGGQATPAFGFAIGMERLILLLEQCNFPLPTPKPLIYLVTEEQSKQFGLALAERLRSEGFKIELHCGSANIKSQFKKALKSGAVLVLTLEQNHVEKSGIGADPQLEISFLEDERKPREFIPIDQLSAFLKNYLQKD